MGRSRSALQESNRSPSTSAAAMQTAVDGTKRPPLREEDPSGERMRAERGGRALRDTNCSRRRYGTRARSPSTSAATMQIAVDGTKRPPLREEDPSGEYFRAERRRGASPARHEPQSKRERRRGRALRDTSR